MQASTAFVACGVPSSNCSESEDDTDDGKSRSSNESDSSSSSGGSNDDSKDGTSRSSEEESGKSSSGCGSSCSSGANSGQECAGATPNRNGSGDEEGRSSDVDANAADDDADTVPNLPDRADEETTGCLADADADGNLAPVVGARARADPKVSPLARVEAQPPQISAAPWAGFTSFTMSNRVPIRGPRAVDSPASESADNPSQSAPMDPDAYSVEGGNSEEAQGTWRTSTDSSQDDVHKKKEQQIHGEPFFTSPTEFCPSVPVNTNRPSPRSLIGQWYCCLNPTRDRI